MDTFELGGIVFANVPPDRKWIAGTDFGQARVFGFPLGGASFNLFWGFDNDAFARITHYGKPAVVIKTREEFAERFLYDEYKGVGVFDGMPLNGTLVLRGEISHYENGVLGNNHGDPAEIVPSEGLIVFRRAAWPCNEPDAPSVIDFMRGKSFYYKFGDNKPYKIDDFDVPPELRQLMVDRGFWETTEGNPDVKPGIFEPIEKKNEAFDDLFEELELETPEEETSSIFPLLLSAALGGVAALALTKKSGAAHKSTAAVKNQQQLPQTYG